MAEEPATRETYTITGNPTYKQRVLARRGVADRVPFLLPHLRSGQRLLDVGCGPGSITCDLAELVAPGETVGLDLQPSQVAAAAALAAERGISNARFEAGSIYELPFPDATFDVATANLVLTHLREPLVALRELRRVLRPGGVVAVVDLDVGATLVSPALPAVERMIALGNRVGEYSGGNPYLGRHHKRLLLEAGFARPEVHANYVAAATPEATRRMAEMFVLRRQGAVQEEIILGEGWATRAELDELYAATYAWGERPDAFLGQLSLGALGWVE